MCSSCRQCALQLQPAAAASVASSALKHSGSSISGSAAQGRTATQPTNSLRELPRPQVAGDAVVHLVGGGAHVRRHPSPRWRIKQRQILLLRRGHCLYDLLKQAQRALGSAVLDRPCAVDKASEPPQPPRLLDAARKGCSGWVGVAGWRQGGGRVRVRCQQACSQQSTGSSSMRATCSLAGWAPPSLRLLPPQQLTHSQGPDRLSVPLPPSCLAAWRPASQ